MKDHLNDKGFTKSECEINPDITAKYIENLIDDLKEDFISSCMHPVDNLEVEWSESGSIETDTCQHYYGSQHNLKTEFSTEWNCAFNVSGDIDGYDFNITFEASLHQDMDVSDDTVIFKLQEDITFYENLSDHMSKCVVLECVNKFLNHIDTPMYNVVYHYIISTI